MAEDRSSCHELVALVREMGPKSLNRLRYLDELVDMADAAKFTGLAVESVRSMYGRGQRRRKAGDVRWAWPEPDLLVAGHPAWKLRTLVLGRASMPGRGKGGAPTRTRFDAATRDQAVTMARETTKSAAQVAAELGINVHTVASWLTLDQRAQRETSGYD